MSENQSEQHVESHDPPVPDAYAAFMRTGWADREQALTAHPVVPWAAARRARLAEQFAGERLVVIDLPQVVDLVANPFASDVLLRDCRTVCAWFAARGLDVDADALFADLLGQAL